MKIRPEDYDKLEDTFFALAWLMPGITEESLAAIKLGFARKTKSQTIASIRLGLNDILDIASTKSNAELLEIDRLLATKELFGLSDLLSDQTSKVARIVKRGKIKNELEQYMMMNQIASNSIAMEDIETVDKMIEEFGARYAKNEI